MAQRNPSKITTSFEVDEPLQQGPKFEMDADDRQYIDNQIRGTQQRVIDLATNGVGDPTGAANVGDGEAHVFKAKVGTNLQLRTLKAGPNITITQNEDDISFDATGDLTGTVDVDDDIGKSGPSTIDRVLGLKGVQFETGDTLGVGQVWKKRGSKLRAAKSVMPGYFDFEDYGGVPDFVNGVSGTDNLAAWEAMLATLYSEGHRCIKIIMDGHFYFSDTLTLTQTISIKGTGMNEPPPFGASRSPPGTMLVFPKNVTGIRIRSAAALDLPEQTYGADRTHLEDLTLWCKEINDSGDPETLGDGVFSTVLYSMKNVIIENFARHGVHTWGSYLVTGDGNASCSFFQNVIVGGGGVDGFHTVGADATICTFVNCTAVVNRRYGVYDETRMNCYVGIHCEGNGAPGLLEPFIAPIDADHGSEYHTEATYNSSTFIGCYHEQAAVGHESIFKGKCNIIGGAIGDSEIHPDSTCFIQECGVAARAPYVYSHTRGGPLMSVSLGEQDGAEMVALKWATPEAPNVDYSRLTYNDTDKFWTLFNSSTYRQPIRFPTVNCNWRQAAPWFLHGVFLGGDAGGVAQVSFTAATTPPTVEYSGAPLTYEKGDVCWQSLPDAGDELGSRCVVAGTQGTLNGGLTTGTIANGSDDLTVSDYSYLKVGQRIAVAGMTGTRKIIQVVSLYVFKLSAINADATVTGGAVSFVAPTFETLEMLSSTEKTKLDGLQRQGASVAIAAYEIDWALGGVFYKTLAAGANTFTFANDTDGWMINVEVTGSTSTLDWPGGIRWPGGTPPVQSSTGVTIYTLVKTAIGINGTAVDVG